MNLTMKLAKRVFAVFAAITLVFTVAACEGFESPLNEIVDSVSIVYSAGDSDVAVTQDVSLPTSFGDATISWTSSNQNVISNEGDVTRGFSDVTVTLTARVDLNGEVATVNFTVTVLGYDADAMLDDLSLTGANISYNATLELFEVTGDFTIPQSVDGFSVSWSSTAPSIVSTDGVVNIPEYGQPDAIVTLTASINGVELDFELVVKASTVAPDPDMVRLEEAKVLLLISGVSDGVLVDVDLPMFVGAEGSADRVSVTWSSSNPAVLADDGTVTRPAPGSGNVTVTMTATLTLNGKSVTKDFELIVIEEVSATPTDSIADAIAKSIDENGNVAAFYAFIPGVTILGITNDGVVIMDDTGILFMYGADGDDLAIGEVYDVQGVTDNYFGGWQLGQANGQPIIFIPSSEAATPFNPTVSASVNDILATTHIPNATDKYFNYEYYQVTAKVVVTDPANRYGTFLTDVTYTGDGSDITVDPNSAQELEAWMIYYQSNYQELHAFDGLEVTLEVLMYSYRTDRTVFTALFFGTAADVSVNLTDAETADLVADVIDGNVDSEYVAEATLELPTSLFGTSISYATDNALLDLTTGVLSMPTEGQETVTLTATITLNAETKVVDYVIYAGESAAISIADALLEASGTLVTVQGYVTMNIDGSNFLLSDGTGSIDIYNRDDAVKTALIDALANGDAVEIIAERGAYNGLEQLSNVQSIRTISAPEFAFPTPVDATGMAQDDLAPYAAGLVRMAGLEVVSLAYDQYGNLDITLTDGTNTIEIRWDSRTVTPEGYPTTLVAGDLVEVIAGVYYSNEVRLRIDSADDVIPFVPSLTMAEALLEASGTKVKVQGFVTMNIDNANFLISDGTGALDIYVGSGDSDVKTALLAALADGTAVELVATRGAYNGLEQLSNVESVNVVASPSFDFPEATDVTAMAIADLENYKAELVFFSGLEVVSLAYDQYGNLDIEVTNGTDTFTIRWDSRTGDPEGYPTTLQTGDKIDVTAGVSWSNSLRLRIDSADDVVVNVPLQTIADALLEASGTLVKVRGYITQNVDNANFFIQDGTGGLDIYMGSSDSAEKTALLDALANGTYVELIASRGAYNGLEQLSGVELVKAIDNPTVAMPDPVDASAMSFADLENYKAQVVFLENLEVVSLSTDQYGNLDIEVTKGTDTFTIRWDSRTVTPEGYPTTLVAGDKINVTAGVYYSNSVRLRIDQASDVEQFVTLFTIADALLESGLVRVQGFVTTNVDGNNFLLQDATGALDIYAGSGTSDAKTALLEALANGTAIEIIASRGAYNGLEQISGIVSVKMLNNPSFNAPTPLDVSAMSFADLSNYISQTVSFTNLEVVSTSTDNYGNLDIEVTNGTDTFTIRWDSRTATPEGYPTTLVAGNTINVVAGVYYSNEVRLRIDEASDVTRFLTEADKVAEDLTAITLPAMVLENGTLTLPIAGEYGSAFTWASSDASVIDAATGAVVIPVGGAVDVTLTATATLSSTSDTRDIVITVGYALSTVAEVRAADVGTTLTVQLTITDMAKDADGDVVAFAEDATAGIYLYKISPELAGALAVGDLVEITANRAVYNDLVQMNGFERVEIISSGNTVTATPVTNPADLAALQGSFVEVTGYLREAYTGTPSNFFLVTTAGIFQLRLVSGSDQDAALRTATQSLLVDVPAGTMFTIKAGVGQYRTTVQLMLINASNITAGAVGSDADLLAAAVANTTLPAAEDDVIANVTLPTSTLFGATIAWSSSDAAVMADDGTVTRPANADTSVTMTYTFTLNAETATGSIDFVVLMEDDSVTTYTETFTNLDLTGTSYGAGSFAGDNGVTWSYTESRGDFELDGKAIMLDKNGDGSSLTATISGGISTFSIQFYDAYSGAAQVEVYINDVLVGTSVSHDGDADDTPVTFTLTGLDTAGDFEIKILAAGAQMVLDNLTWTPFA